MTWFRLVITSFLGVIHVGGRVRLIAVARAWLYARVETADLTAVFGWVCRRDRMETAQSIVNGLSW